MPDKPTHIDETFTDQSWSEMKKMLDKELPVRPAFFFWFRKRFLGLLLLLIPLAAAWGLYQYGLWTQTQNHPIEEIQEETQPASVPASPIASQQSAVGSRQSAVGSEQSPESRILNPASRIPHPESRIPNPEPQIPNPESPYQSFSEVQSLASRILYPVSSAAAFAKVDISHLASLNLDQSIQNEEAQTSELIEINRLESTPKPWTFGLEAGVFSDAGLNSRGLSCGVRINRALGESAWGLQSGLVYARYVRPFEAQLMRGNVALDDLENQAEPLFDTLGQESVDISVERVAISTDSLVSRLHYLDIPLVVSYQAGPRWQLTAGGGMGILLTSQTDTGTYGKSGLLKWNAESFDASPISGGTESSYINPKVHLFNPYLEAGVTYFPTKRLGLSWQFNVGMRDLLSNWPGSQRLNKVQLKASYWFR